MTKLSLITASYNSARTIGDTLRCVNAQTYPDLEYLIVDGGSKDDTMEIVAREGKRVTSAVSEPDKGIYDAYNKGLARATGEVIGFLNSDDFYCSDDVLAQVMKAFEDPSVEGVHADLVYVDPDDPMKIKRHWKSRAFTPEDYRWGLIPAHPTLFLRKSTYDRIGGYDTRFRYVADHDLILRAFYVDKVKHVYVPRIWVRMRTGGATGGKVEDMVAQNEEILSARRTHGIHRHKALFYANKVLNRSMQAARARFVRMPPETTAA